jgi:hypothetical protein
MTGVTARVSVLSVNDAGSVKLVEPWGRNNGDLKYFNVNLIAFPSRITRNSSPRYVIST